MTESNESVDGTDRPVDDSGGGSRSDALEGEGESDGESESVAEPGVGADPEPESGVDTAELPTDVVDEAERLTRIARRTPDENEAEARREWRERLLAEHDFTSRIRDDDGDDVLVLHPAEWHDDENDVIRTDRIEDLSRAVETPLEGTGDPDDWETVNAHNRELADRVRERHGDVHGDNAAALADFVGNHYAKRIEDLTSEELEEFRSDYFVRNAWPSEKQRDIVDDSIERVYETAGTPVPDERGR